MTKRYWAGVMLFSLVMTGAAGWYLYTALQEKASVSVPLKEVQRTPANPNAVNQSTSTNSAQFPITTSSVLPDAKTAPKSAGGETNATGETRRILFKVKSAKARHVFLVGDFGKWFRQPMTKEGALWSASVDLKPGTYEYKFVINGKRVRDPNNKTVSKKGNSVLQVKSASPR